MKAHRSIRRRLFFQLAGVAALLSLAFFLVVRELAEQAAEASQDDILAASATSIADSLNSETDGITLDLPYSALSMLGTINEDRVFYRVAANDKTLTGYDDLPSPRNSPQLGTPVYTTYSYRGEVVRAVSVVRSIGPATDITEIVVTVAQTRSGFVAITQRITATATGIGLGFFLLATALSLLASNSALAPIARIADSVARRGPKELRAVVAETPTEIVPLVVALNSFMARLRASLLQTEDFIAEAAHRVRTPLATVRAQAEVTYRKLNKPEHKKAIREMIGAIDESSRSAGQMLDHAMVTFRADSLTRVDVDLNSLMAEVCDRLRPTADLKDITIRQFPAEAPVLIKGDRILIQAALQNILDNAIKYSFDDGEIAVKIEADTQIRLSVSDLGRGFGDIDLEQLTTRFVRGANVEGIVGSGLGLTIADEVATAHDGRLEIIQNPEGVGACVSIIFPRI